MGILELDTAMVRDIGVNATVTYAKIKQGRIIGYRAFNKAYNWSHKRYKEAEKILLDKGLINDEDKAR